TDVGADIRRYGHLLAEEVGVAVIEAQHVDDGRRHRRRELSHFVIGTRDHLATPVRNQRRGIEWSALPGLPCKPRMLRVDEPIEADVLLVVSQSLDRRAHKIRALYSGAIGDRDI